MSDISEAGGEYIHVTSEECEFVNGFYHIPIFPYSHIPIYALDIKEAASFTITEFIISGIDFEDLKNKRSNAVTVILSGRGLHDKRALAISNLGNRRGEAFWGSPFRVDRKFHQLGGDEGSKRVTVGLRAGNTKYLIVPHGH